MNKIIIKKIQRECIIKQRHNQNLLKHLPNDLDDKLKRAPELREEFSDIIPIKRDIIENCHNYLTHLENEDYQSCDKFIIED